MQNPVMIKSSSGALRVCLSTELSFEELLTCVCEKFAQSAEFFGSANLPILFEGRRLSIEEEDILLEGIKKNSHISVPFLIDTDKRFANFMARLKTPENKSENEEKTSDIDILRYHRGTLKKGDSLFTKSDITILGDVHLGARVEAVGDVIIFGSLKGSVKAGTDKSTQHCVAALNFEPEELELSGVKYEGIKSKKLFSKKTAQVAKLRDGQIVLIDR